MNKILTAAAIGALAFAAASSVLALDSDATTSSDTMQQVPAATPDDIIIDHTGSINRVRLVEGENSFTENQARERIEKSGFTKVSTLTMDEMGIWRGTASKGATVLKVGLDYKGNVAADRGSNN